MVTGAVQSLSGGVEASGASAEGERTLAETPAETLQRIHDFTRWLCQVRHSFQRIGVACVHLKLAAA